MTRRLVQVGLLALCLTALAVPSFAQVFTGRIDITAKDSTGAILPGVTVELTGVQPATQVTDSRGEVHFLNLPPGRYTVTGKLSGFNNYVNNNVPVGAGSVIALDVTLTVGNVSENVAVTAETPVIETKKETISTNVTLDELQNVPTSRDPWVVLQTVPSVIVDRVNVGGAESGQQSNYQAKGAGGRENTWNIDGIAITDMAAIGSSPTYYDFDMFQDMQVTTGGSDPANATPGVQLNMVLRSGTNAWRGSARYYFENNSLQGDNVGTSVANQITSYNRTKQYFDTGGEGGGPVMKDKLFVWAAYGQTEPKNRIFTFNSSAGEFRQSAIDETILKNTSFKVDAAATANVRGNFTYFRGDKQKFGRGASATRPDETTFNQTGPTNLYKGEINYTIGNNLFVTGRYAHTAGGFGFEPRGGLDTTAYRDEMNVWHGTYYQFKTNRPQDNVQFEANYFTGRSEFKAGFGWRKASVTSSVAWPGGIYTFDCRPGDTPDPCPASYSADGYMRAVVARDWSLAADSKYLSGFVADTITGDRWTMNLGVRFDRSANSIGAASVPGNDLSPLLGPLTAPAESNAVVWNSVTPRIGFTYALDEARKSIVRASYAMFASQLDSNIGATIASAIPYYSYAYYLAKDANGDGRAQANEFQSFLYTYGFDPTNPLGGNPNTIGDYGTPLTHEITLGAEHELMANFGISGTFTYRRYVNFNWLHFRGVSGANYIQAGTLSGNTNPIGPYDVPFYMVDPAAAPADFGKVYESRPDYYQRYMGLELVATKRMSNNWMMRMSWSGGANREYFQSLDGQADPTPTVPGTSQFTLGSPNKSGGIVITQSGGSGKSNIYLALPKYQFSLTTAYQAKYGINFGLNYLFRQGFSEPYYQSNAPGTADDLSGNKSVLLVSSVEDYRLPDVHSVDARVSKALTFQRYNVNIDFDVFNLFNQAITLGKQYDVSSSSFNTIQEITNPRIARIGVRFSFR